MPTYTISDLAREFGITLRTIRFYEDYGLVCPAREGAGGRNRVYTARERTRLKLTLRGKRLGLALSEIKKSGVERIGKLFRARSLGTGKK